MLAETVAQQDHDLLWAAVVTGALSFIGVLVVAVLAQLNRTTAKNVAADILESLDTGNSHTAGQSLTRLEDMAWRHEQRLDTIEVKLMEGQTVHGEFEARTIATNERLEQIHAEHVEENAQLMRLHTEHLGTRAQVGEVQQTLDLHLGEVADVVEWTRQQMEREEQDDG
jgi:hypothetical protein